MPKVFISYRRDDSADATGRLHDRLSTEFGADSVFIDIDNIPYGVDFREHLAEAVEKCDVFLAIIGDLWLDIRDSEGARRLENDADSVRFEIASALQRCIPVIPILTGDQAVPKAEELPDDLRDLAFRNGAEIRAGADFHKQVDRLIESIREMSSGPERPSHPNVPPRSSTEHQADAPVGTGTESRGAGRWSVGAFLRWVLIGCVRFLKLLVLKEKPKSMGSQVFRAFFHFGFLAAAPLVGILSMMLWQDTDDGTTAMWIVGVPVALLYIFAWAPSVMLMSRSNRDD